MAKNQDKKRIDAVLQRVIDKMSEAFEINSSDCEDAGAGRQVSIVIPDTSHFMVLRLSPGVTPTLEAFLNHTDRREKIPGSIIDTISRIYPQAEYRVTKEHPATHYWSPINLDS